MTPRTRWEGRSFDEHGVYRCRHGNQCEGPLCVPCIKEERELAVAKEREHRALIDSLIGKMVAKVDDHFGMVQITFTDGDSITITEGAGSLESMANTAPSRGLSVTFNSARSK